MERTYIKNKRIAKLEIIIKEGKKDAIDLFWSEVEEKGAPLIEDIDNDDNI